MVDVKFDSLKGVKPHEFILRFLFGGISTAAAGLIAMHFGPGIGGLFLAFPAIFPAGASMIEKHEREKKQKAGFDGTDHGRAAAGVDALGAATGCVGLAGFAVVLVFGLVPHNACGMILLAMLAWLAISIGVWLFCKSRILRRRHPAAEHPSHATP
jgi:hypothetical protein